jgi:hypothetical protein
MRRAGLLMNTFAQFKLLLVKAVEEEKAARGGGEGPEAAGSPRWQMPKQAASPKRPKVAAKRRSAKKTKPKKATRVGR